MIPVPDGHLADTWILRPDVTILVRTCRGRRRNSRWTYTTSVFENVTFNGAADLLVSLSGPDDASAAWRRHIDAVNRWNEAPEETT